ncbi:MAG: hypothetical protein A2096_06895 [Spirochaetes bacterium GWF1_41_5]|nr:MAG: hypothetical protein A2096_06895 [Spirochaetes bacterium GWF1_41_5]HBE03601.1 hypothetical protein [Spirochaetia bacterium]
MNSAAIKVNIFGSEYAIKAADNNREHIKSVASFLDRKIREFRNLFPLLSFDKLLILASLNICDELLKKSPAESADQAQPAENCSENELQLMLEKVKILLEEEI